MAADQKIILELELKDGEIVINKLNDVEKSAKSAKKAMESGSIYVRKIPAYGSRATHGANEEWKWT